MSTGAERWQDILAFIPFFKNITVEYEQNKNASDSWSKWKSKGGNWGNELNPRTFRIFCNIWTCYIFGDFSLHFIQGWVYRMYTACLPSIEIHTPPPVASFRSLDINWEAKLWRIRTVYTYVQIEWDIDMDTTQLSRERAGKRKRIDGEKG